MIDLGIEIRVKEISDEKFPNAKLVAVKGMPATGQAGGTVETTTSSDAVKVYIADRPDTGEMDFTYNYSAENFAAVQAKCDNTQKDILVKLPDGTGVLYRGSIQTWINEVSVGSVIECALHTVPSIAPSYKTADETAALIITSA